MWNFRRGDHAELQVLGREPPRRLELVHIQRVIDPLRLRLVLEVDRHGSISRAAEACSMSQPTASAHLKTLEAATQHRLLERAGGGTRLTDAGRVVAKHAAMVLSTLEGLEQELAALEGARTGTLRIASCAGFGYSVLPDALAQFATHHPGADFKVQISSSGEVLRAVARGEAHLGVAGQGRKVPGVVTELLLEDELIGIAPPSFSAHGGMVNPAALEKRALIVSRPDSSTRALTERLLARLGIHPARMLELDSVEAVKRAVRSGLGLAFISRLATTDELARGELTAFEVVGVGQIERWLELVRPEVREPAPLDQAFERILRNACATAASQSDNGPPTGKPPPGGEGRGAKTPHTDGPHRELLSHAGTLLPRNALP